MLHAPAGAGAHAFHLVDEAVICISPRLLRRWYSGEQEGFLTATSCGATTNDPVLSVLSSPNMAGGPWACVGGNDDAPASECPGQSAWQGAFTFRFPFERRTW